MKIGTDCGTNTIATGITINATTSVTVNAPTTIITGDTYISGDTTIGGDTFISGDTTVDGDLIINIPCDSITSTTVNDALCEIMGRGAVTMTRDSSPSDTRLSAVYKLYQNGSQIGYDINVPKDGFLKSVELINDGNTYYLRFTWYIYDADTQTYTTGSTDVNIEDLVKDIDENNSKTDRGVNVDVWYNETAKKMNVSADTTVTIKNNGGSGTKTFTKSAGTHTLTAYTLSYTHNGFTGSFDPFEANSSFTSPHSALTVNYGGSICNSSSTVTYNTSADKSITIPTKVNDIKRSILKWDYGSVSAKSASDYDPGSYTGAGCTGDATNSITIPKSIDHLTNWNGTCISLPHDTCITGKLEVSNGVYNTSDERLKSDIKRVEYPQMLEARKVGIKQFYYNSDPSKRVTYGVIAQDVQAHNLNEMVYEDEGGFLSVDYTSLMILKIAYLENEVERLTHILGEISDKIK